MAQGPAVDADDLLPAEQPIVLYDGVCNLCNGLVQFVLPRDPEGTFRFAPLQSAPGQALLGHFGMARDDFDTFVLVDGEDVHERSDAALRIASELRFPWSVLGGFLHVPRVVRDAAYDLVARYRYDVFGRSDRCRLPEDGAGDVFLDGADVIPDEE